MMVCKKKFVYYRHQRFYLQLEGGSCDNLFRCATASVSSSQQRSLLVAAPVAVSSVMQQVHTPVPFSALQISGSSSAFVSPTGASFVPLPIGVNQISKKEVGISSEMSLQFRITLVLILVLFRKIRSASMGMF